MAEESQSSSGWSEQRVIDLLKEQIQSLERERDRLREELAEERARIEGLTERAVAAETRADMLARNLDDRRVEAPATTPVEHEHTPAVTASQAQAPAPEERVELTAEQIRRRRAAESKWWEFWKRWEPQEPWGKGQHR